MILKSLHFTEFIRGRREFSILEPDFFFLTVFLCFRIIQILNQSRKLSFLIFKWKIVICFLQGQSIKSLSIFRTLESYSHFSLMLV